MRTLTAAVALVLTTALASAQEEGADALLGQWYTEDDASIVNVVKKTDGKYYGTIIWLDEPEYPADDKEAGKPRRDRENPDKQKQRDPIIGLSVLKGFSHDASDAKWDGGTIYDPENGKTYKCVIRIADEKAPNGMTKLNVRGYIGIPALGRTTVWVRVPKEKQIDLEAVAES